MRLSLYKYSHANGISKIRTKSALVLSVVGLALGGGGLSLAMLNTANADANDVIVTPANMQGWAFFDDNGAGGSGSMVTGPATSPLGVGSAQLSINGGAQGYAFGAALDGGTPLLSITSLSYSTYVQQGNNTVAPALQLNFDPNVTSNVSNWYGRMVYEPYYTHAVTDGTWQTWNTQDNATNGTNGNWWFSHASQLGSSCTQATPCTWSQITAEFPNGGINTGVNAGVVFKAGSGWTVPFVGNIDAFTIGVNNSDTTYNFEPTVSPMTKDDCMNGGWQNSNTPSFSNQGQCVSWVNHSVLSKGKQ